METTEEEKTFKDTHDLGELLDSWKDWVEENEKGSIEIEYDEDDDIFLVERDGRKAVLYTSDIDEDFYGEPQSVFAESEIGIPPETLDWNQTLKFSGNELVLSRISLSERDENDILISEGALPLPLAAPALFDLLVREVATIARDLRQHLSAVLLDPPAKEISEDEDEAEEDTEATEDADE